MQKQGVSDAPQLVAAGQAIIILARLEGRPAQDYQLAMKLFAKARDEVDRLYWPASLAEAQLLIEKDNPEDALAAVTDVLRLNPRSADAALMIGEFAASRFAFDEAAKITARLREVQPDHLLASIIDATAYLTQKDAETARTVIEPALAKYPNHRELLALLASVEALTYNDAQLQRVLAHYDKLSGENPMALVTAGSYLAHARQYEASEKLLLQAVERQPNWALPRIELGLMLMQAGKESDALLQLRQARPQSTQAR
jgi:tetratricopeptide (TPR) repeat protein